MQHLERKYSIINLQGSRGMEEGISLEIDSLRPQEFQQLRNRNFYRYGYTTRNPNAASGRMGFNMLQFRIDVDGFKLRKKQAKILRRFDRFLNGVERKSNPKKSKNKSKQTKNLAMQFTKQQHKLLKDKQNQSIQGQIKAHETEILKLKSIMESILSKKLTKSSDSKEINGVELCPYGVKQSGTSVGIRCVFSKKEYSGVWEDVLLEEFLKAIDLGNFEEIGFRKEKKSKTKVFEHANCRYKVTFQARKFRIDLAEQYLVQKFEKPQATISENTFVSKNKGNKEKIQPVHPEIREYFGATNPEMPLKFEIKLEKPTVSNEKFILFDRYMKEIHGNHWSSKSVRILNKLKKIKIFFY